MALPIPPPYIPRINKVRNLESSALAELIEALSSSTLTANSDAMTGQIAGSVPSIPIEDLTEIVDLVYALYHVREYSELSWGDFFREFIDGVKKQSDPPMPPEELQAVAEKFKGLLRIKNLESITKAISLQREGERLYCGAKILSDIRPVFGPAVDSMPVAGVITHTLKLNYHENGQHKTVFVVLDEEDLVNLRSVIERAEAKAKTLDAFLSANIPRLGV
jgi:hypothetical protein